MPDDFTLSDQHKLIVKFARSRLESLQVDTSKLDDQEMMMRLAMVMEIMDSREMEDGLNQALAEYSGRFLDLGALTGEMMVAAEGARH